MVILSDVGWTVVRSKRLARNCGRHGAGIACEQRSGATVWGGRGCQRRDRATEECCGNEKERKRLLVPRFVASGLHRAVACARLMPGHWHPPCARALGMAGAPPFAWFCFGPQEAPFSHQASARGHPTLALQPDQGPARPCQHKSIVARCAATLVASSKRAVLCTRPEQENCPCLSRDIPAR